MGDSEFKTLDDVLEAHKPEQASVSLCVDGQLNRRMQQIIEQARRAEADSEDGSLADNEAQQLYEQAEELREQVRAATVEFVFEAIGDRPWDKLVEEHPATKQQREDDSYGWDFNESTFQPVAIAASLISPEGVTVGKVDKLQDTLSKGQWRRLWGACLAANVGGYRDELGKDELATGLMRSIRGSLTTADNGASPDRSSSEESLAQTSPAGQGKTG